jgi:hypothetical protein
MSAAVPAGSSQEAVIALLAATLEVQAALRRHSCVRIILPRWVHQSLDQEVFGAVLSDVLRHEFSDLDQRLTIEVKATDHFSLQFP